MKIVSKSFVYYFHLANATPHSVGKTATPSISGILKLLFGHISIDQFALNLENYFGLKLNYAIKNLPEKLIQLLLLKNQVS